MHTLDDYKKLGKLMGLEFIGDRAPLSVRESAQWVCIKCGRRKNRCYNKLKYDVVGCRCGGTLALGPEDYHRVAASLGIQWIAKRTPLTVQAQTNWMSADGRFFQASYHQLGYDPLSIPQVYHNFLPKQTVDKILALREERLEAIRQRNAQL